MKRTLAILTGGKSQRMGVDKALLPFGECSVIEYLVARFSVFFEDIWLSVDDDQKYQHLADKVQIVEDVHQDIGPLGGIYSVLGATKTEKVAVIAVDMPFLSPKGLAYLYDHADHKNYFVQCENDQIQSLYGVYQNWSYVKKKYKLNGTNFTIF